MTAYVALIRGIMPANPNTRNEKLRATFEKLGFSNVQTIISSGNVVFESSLKSSLKIEKTIEEGLLQNLNFKNSVIVRSKKELESIQKNDPFKKKMHSKESYLIVTFLKKKPFEIFASLDLSKNKTPDFMSRAEKEYGKEITTRTWKTIEKIITKMRAS